MRSGRFLRGARMAVLCAAAGLARAELPSSFDLRNVNGTNYMTAVKSQSGGTCWTHGTMAALESNLRVTGVWTCEGESGEPNLAEYHLDWWNGFNQHNNDDRDPPAGGGLVVHNGGDYLVASAYLTRGEGAVRDIDGQSYTTPPLRYTNTYHRYLPRHVEWYVAGANLTNIAAIKQAVMDHGALGTCMYYGGGFYSGGTHYQPPSDPNDPNHSVAIAGWDDDKDTQAPEDGAWLCKNSWGSGWGSGGYFWISYYDKHAGQHPEMGAVSFRDVARFRYDRVYCHDYHGWRDTMATNAAFNAFTAHEDEVLEAVSFYTAADDVVYELAVYSAFADGQLQGELSRATGTLARTGCHTMALQPAVNLLKGAGFRVFLDLSRGGQPFDRTSEVEVLLGSGAAGPDPVSPDNPRAFEAYLRDMGKTVMSGTEVVSASQAGQSYFREGTNWVDLTTVEPTGNFCLKGFAVLMDSDGDGEPNATDPDDDDDGMPDTWEETYGFCRTNAADAAEDADRDGLANLSEYIAGTEPTNAASVFRLEECAAVAAGSVLRWPSVSNRTYAVYWTTNLLSETGFALLTNGLPATPALNVYTDSVHAGEQQLHYRIGVEW